VRGNKSAIPFDFIFYIILVLRKILPLEKYAHFEAREWRIGKIIRFIFFSKVKPDIIVTMSNSMLGFFRGWSDTMPLYDYQHGIVYSWHPGYILNKEPASHVVKNKSKILLFGRGFGKLLIKGNDYYLKNGICIGTGMEFKKLHKQFNKRVLVSLPITSIDDFDQAQKEIMEKLEMLFSDNESFYVKNGISFSLKHHPRFDGFYNLDSIMKFSFVCVTNKTLVECLTECSLHVTYNSTTTFEASVLGIPTLFLTNEGGDLLFKEEFQYPDYQGHLNIQKKIEEFNSNPLLYNSTIELAQEWVKDFYEPFNEYDFLKLINEKD
jgi:hypothetical protein